jgi:hypothetical protein
VTENSKDIARSNDTAARSLEEKLQEDNQSAIGVV